MERRAVQFVPLEAVSGLVPSGARLALGGMTLYRRPVALVRELLRGETRDLELVAFTGGYETDLLLGAGRVRRLRSCYVGLETFGLAPMFTAGAAAGGFELQEETEVTLALGLRAALGKVDFLPHPGVLGTDIPSVRPDLATVTAPGGGRPFLAVPPLHPEVAFLHAPCADRRGNVHLGGNLAVDRQLAALATTTVVSVERVVDDLGTFGADVMARHVTHVVECPGGARPSSCWPEYPLTGTALVEYQVACAMGRFEDYLAALLEPDQRLDELGRIAGRLGLEELLA